MKRRYQKSPLNFRFEQKAEGSGDVYRLYLYDDISKYGEFDWNTWKYKDSETSAKYMRDRLNEIPVNSTIELHINSAGGEVGEGVTIYNLLRQKSESGCLIIGYVDGYAYSVAMDIAMACDEIHMGLGTTMFLHYPWMYCAGNAEALRGYADQLDALGEASLKLYMARAKDITEDELREMMQKETCLDPETCLKYGFCDVIDGYSAEKPPLDGDPDEKDKDEDDPEELKRQLREMALTRQEIEKMFQGIKARDEPTPAPDPKQGKKPEPESQQKTEVRSTLIEAMRRISGNK